MSQGAPHPPSGTEWKSAAVATGVVLSCRLQCKGNSFPVIVVIIISRYPKLVDSVISFVVILISSATGGVVSWVFRKNCLGNL